MQWTIPGTTLKALRPDADRTDALLRSMFLAGGLTLSQVATVTGLEAHTVQNWVKRGFLTAPRGKRYDLEQLCRILNINLLKGALPLEQTAVLLAYLNGDLTDESDDLIDDALLYCMFVKLAARARHLGGSKAWDEAIAEITQDYREPVPGAREKLQKVLKIMITAWCANRLQQEAETMIQNL